MAMKKGGGYPAEELHTGTVFGMGLVDHIWLDSIYSCRPGPVIDWEVSKLATALHTEEEDAPLDLLSDEGLLFLHNSHYSSEASFFMEIVCLTKFLQLFRREGRIWCPYSDYQISHEYILSHQLIGSTYRHDRWPQSLHTNQVGYNMWLGITTDWAVRSLNPM